AHSVLTNLWVTVAVAETEAVGGPEPHFLLFGRSQDQAPPANPVADFIYSPVSPLVGQVVSFQDFSRGGPTSWSWDFGDGKSSTEQNPIHTFQAASTYPVTLTVSGNSTSSMIAKSILILPAGPRAPSI